MKKLILLIIVIFAACSVPNKEKEVSISELADNYLEQIIATFPESSYFVDIPIGDHSGFSSNDPESVLKWEEFEDSLYARLLKIDESKILDKVDRISYWLLKEELESSIDMRVCKRELWNVNPMWGFHHLWSKIADFQPVGNDSLREQAFKRWNNFPEYVDTEIANLNAGAERGYTMPGEIVELVIKQVNALTGYSLEDSPLMSPARRDSAAIFQKEWRNLVTEKINPALSKYSDYLQNDYLGKARTEVSVLALPNGNDCYQAFIRDRTTTKKTGEEIFDQGMKIVKNNISTIEKLGKDLYQSSDFMEIISLIEKDSSLYFTSSDEILAYNNAILDSAKSRSRDWFTVLPSSEVTIKPYLSHESGIGSYESATENKPAFFRINLNNPRNQTFPDNEKLSFHEAYPGHHLQIGIEKDIQGLHSIRKLIGFGSFVEGWARYSEQLAEEMGLYNHKASLIGRRAWPSRGMVADPALHIKRWPKDSLVNFMTASGMNKETATSLYYRMIIFPAQLTSYDVGGEEIKSLRILAEEKLGDSFDIKEFHDKILENGSIPLSSLRFLIEQWIENKLTATKDKMQ